ncbi:hypothetical protein CT0861_09509 [Colletotrichum tofieldiae]|uniref:Uncharacterized protein n=1 Tax=Colletotrichum tofieldiae TaxID=708197 RepID=A0A166NN39_9PEZI|nr:hypothetical protein CT0861_09509 [Colletotrichum tofieldiae]
MNLVSDTCYPDLDEKGEAWGKAASNVPDPPKCIETCRTRFFERVVPGFDETKYAEVCKVLSNREMAVDRLWELYCCDSTSCGVQLNGNLGQDPSVNFIINTCQNIGSGIIQDPGPPAVGYACPISSDDKPSDPCPRPFMMTDARGPASTKINSLATLTPDFTTLTTSASVVARSSTRATDSTMKTSGVSSSISNQYQRNELGGLSIGSKVAIGAASGVAFLAFLAFTVCLFRRRTRGEYAKDLKSEIKHLSVQQARSPTPLISPSRSTHGANRTLLTPPPRLQERRLLPSPLSPTKPGINISIPRTSLGAAVAQTSPLSPASIPSPTAGKLPPRFDRSTKPYYGIPPPTAFSGTSKAGKTASFNSTASRRAATTVPIILSSLPHHIPSSPTRPVRPHDQPLHIPDLVCPGPPPTRSLPPPPARSPSRPVSLSSNQHREDSHRNFVTAIGNGWVPPRNPARGVVLGKEAKDLCDLTETCAREQQERGSWGSWAIGDGGMGIGMSLSKGGGRVNSPVLEEADLERIGGRY